MERLITFSESDYEDMLKLLPQLSQTYSTTKKDFENAVMDKNTYVLAVRDDGHIVGMATLVLIRKIGGTFARMEDVVVDESQRGTGLGTKLFEALVETARNENVKAIEFTSKPEREAANALYQKLGFEKKETNVYKMEL